MEITEKLKQLYKHWEKHSCSRNNRFLPGELNSKTFYDIAVFITERMQVFYRKERNEQKPYSTIPLLNSYRFCNIYRELDRQTIFFHTLLKPIESNFPLWLLNMLFCRSICNTETVSKIGILSFDSKQNEQVFTELLRLPSPKYGNAYVFPISVIQKSVWPTREKFFCHYYPLIIKKIADRIGSFGAVSVVEALENVLPLFGFNLKFLWTEVFIDVAYQYPSLIDLFKEFPCGPGSIPTMKTLNPTKPPEAVILDLIASPVKNFPYLTYNGGKIQLSAENWEGVGCEFRKYTNLLAGNGRKRKFN